MSDKCQTKISNEKKHQEFERFYVRQTSDIRGESDIKDFVGFAYYQTKFDIKIPYALFEIQPDTGWISKTCSFDHQKTVKGIALVGHKNKKEDQRRWFNWIFVFEE